MDQQVTHQPTRFRIDRPLHALLAVKLKFTEYLYFRKFYAVLPEIIMQMLHGDIIVDHSRIVKLVYLRDTRRERRNLPSKSQHLSHINGNAHHRTLNRGQLRNQLVLMLLNIVHHSCTGLGDHLCPRILLNITDMRPGTDIRSQSHIVDGLHSLIAQPLQGMAPVSVKGNLNGRRRDHGHLFPVP